MQRWKRCRRRRRRTKVKKALRRFSKEGIFNLNASNLVHKGFFSIRRRNAKLFMLPISYLKRKINSVFAVISTTNLKLNTLRRRNVMVWLWLGTGAHRQTARTCMCVRVCLWREMKCQTIRNKVASCPNFCTTELLILYLYLLNLCLLPLCSTMFIWLSLSHRHTDTVVYTHTRTGNMARRMNKFIGDEIFPFNVCRNKRERDDCKLTQEHRQTSRLCRDKLSRTFFSVC